MRILITGAAGKVGRAVRRELAAAGHELRLTDVRLIEQPEGESRLLDVTDGLAVLDATQGMEAVVHLAYGSDRNDNSEADIRLNFEVNVKGTYYLLWAARQAGVKRFVYTSTLSVFGGTGDLASSVLDEHSPHNPSNPYGLTKWMGEEVCSFFARRHGSSVVVLRLCGVATEDRWERIRNRMRRQADDPERRLHRGICTHVDDVARAVHLALTVPNLRYELLHIAADNNGRVTEIGRAKQVLGFHPQYRLED